MKWPDPLPGFFFVSFTEFLWPPRARSSRTYPVSRFQGISSHFHSVFSLHGPSGVVLPGFYRVFRWECKKKQTTTDWRPSKEALPSFLLRNRKTRFRHLEEPVVKERYRVFCVSFYRVFFCLFLATTTLVRRANEDRRFLKPAPSFLKA